MLTDIKRAEQLTKKGKERREAKIFAARAEKNRIQEAKQKIERIVEGAKRIAKYAEDKEREKQMQHKKLKIQQTE